MPIEEIDRKILKIEGQVHQEVDPEQKNDELISNESDSNNVSSSEDSDAELLDEETNITTLDLIKKIRTKDPQIYNSEFK